MVVSQEYLQNRLPFTPAGSNHITHSIIWPLPKTHTSERTFLAMHAHTARLSSLPLRRDHIMSILQQEAKPYVPHTEVLYKKYEGGTVKEETHPNLVGLKRFTSAEEYVQIGNDTFIHQTDTLLSTNSDSIHPIGIRHTRRMFNPEESLEIVEYPKGARYELHGSPDQATLVILYDLPTAQAINAPTLFRPPLPRESCRR